jgi:hypothetical protein
MLATGLLSYAGDAAPAGDGTAEPTLVEARCRCRGNLAMARCRCRDMLCDRSRDLRPEL